MRLMEWFDLDVVDLREVVRDYEWLVNEASEGVELDEDERDFMTAVGQLNEQIALNLEFYATNAKVLVGVDEREEYAKAFAEDIGAIDNSYRWPGSHVDWEAAAAALFSDAEHVIVDGREFYIR